MKARNIALLIPLFFHTCAPWDYAHARGLGGVPRSRPVAMRASAIRMPPPVHPLPIGSMRRDMRFTNHFLNVRQRGAVPNRLPVIPIGSRGVPGPAGSSGLRPIPAVIPCSPSSHPNLTGIAKRRPCAKDSLTKH